MSAFRINNLQCVKKKCRMPMPMVEDFPYPSMCSTWDHWNDYRKLWRSPAAWTRIPRCQYRYDSAHPRDGFGLMLCRKARFPVVHSDVNVQTGSGFAYAAQTDGYGQGGSTNPAFPDTDEEYLPDWHSVGGWGMPGLNYCNGGVRDTTVASNSENYCAHSGYDTPWSSDFSRKEEGSRLHIECKTGFVLKDSLASDFSTNQGRIVLTCYEGRLISTEAKGFIREGLHVFVPGVSETGEYVPEYQVNRGAYGDYLSTQHDYSFGCEPVRCPYLDLGVTKGGI